MPVAKHAAVVAAFVLCALAAVASPSVGGFVLGALLAGAIFMILNSRGAAGADPAGAERALAPYDRPAESHPYQQRAGDDPDDAELIFWGGNRPARPPWRAGSHRAPRHAAPAVRPRRLTPRASRAA